MPPALQAARTALDNILGEINALADRQANPLPPRTAQRNKQFDAASRAAHVVARLVRGYALQQGLADLAGEVAFSATDLVRGRLTHRLQRMRQVQAAAQAHPAAGIPADILTDLDAKIATADAVLAAPRSHIAERRLATERLTDAFAQLVRHLDYTLDPLMDTHRAADPDAYSRYRTARRVIDRPGSPAEDPDAAPSASAKKTAAASTPATQPLAA